MESNKADEIAKGLAGMGLGASKDDFDVIKKPRTNFTNNVLRRAIPNINIQDKIGSISMNKLNVLSAMRLGPTGGSQVNFGDSKKVHTVSNLPKIQSLDSRMMKDILPKKKQSSSLQNAVEKMQQTGQNLHAPTKGLDGIEEGKIGEEDLEDSSGSGGFDDQSNKSGSSDDDEESSIDMDGDDDEKLYQMIQNEQKDAEKNKDAKNKGSHLDDLVDKEMISLLNICKRLHCPSIDQIQNLMVDFGPKPA